jgi:hypothetical protein
MKSHVPVRPTDKDPGLQRRVPEMETAAKAFQAGLIDKAEYDRIVSQHKPVKPYAFVPRPASDDEAAKALMANKASRWRAHDQWPEGHRVGLRLDIPAYEHHGVWVNSIHDESGQKDKFPTAYAPVSAVENAEFDPKPEKGLRVATGEQNKAPFARIVGNLRHMTEDEAVEHAKAYLNHPEWAQVGYDPRRHGYFYDRRSMKPVSHASHVVQIGPLVLAKGVRYKEPDSYASGGSSKGYDMKTLDEMRNELMAAGGNVSILHLAVGGPGPRNWLSDNVDRTMRGFKSWMEPREEEAKLRSKAVNDWIERNKADGGTVPTLAQMKLALARHGNRHELTDIGVNEAPDLKPKAFAPPSASRSFQPAPGGVATGGIPIGGSDMSRMQPGQQLVPQTVPQPQGAGQRMPQGAPEGAPQGMSQGMPGTLGMGAPEGMMGGQMPPQQGQSNILSLTPQGQALAAMQPQQPQAMASGGEVDGMKDGGSKITKRMQTVKDAQRMAYPGIYDRPDVIAAMAASRVAPEDPALQQLFGVTREDLYQMSKARKGNLPGELPGAAQKPRGSAAAAGVMGNRNVQRLLDVMGEAENHPELVRGMDPWYVMDPLFKRMVELLGLEQAKIEYDKMNHLMGMASPGSEVNTEIPRGTAAYYLQKQGRFGDFFKYAGVPEQERGKRFPADIRNVPGHAYHRTSQATPMQQYLESGQIEMKSPKVPMYIQASGVPETGFQTATPVGDAHWSRAVGLADTRNPKTIKGKQVIPGASVSNPEMTMLAPWWRKEIAEKLGLESVPAQARAWGTFSPQTGVTTPIGAPKLELIAKKIMETANRMGVSPETARDYVLTGKTYAGKKKGGKIGKDMDTIRLEMTKKAK